MRNAISILGLLLASSSLIACDQEYDPDAPAIDPNAPRVRITSPARGTFAGDVREITVKGIATDDQGVTSVVVNGVSAAVQADGSWEVNVPVTDGTNLLHAIAKDAQDNVGKETRAVVTGPLESISSPVPSALTAAMTAQAFDAVGRGITGFMTGPTLMNTVTPLNPVIDAGAPEGPDCLYVQGSITNVSLDATTKITLSPQTGGIYLSAELVRPRINMGLNWSAACLDGARAVTVSAQKISINGVLKVGVNGGKFEIYLDDEDVRITGFDVDLGGIPGEIIDMLHLDTALGPILAWVTEKVAVPYLNDALAGLNDTKTVDVLGTPVNINVKPARIEIDPAGLLIELDTEMRAQNDSASPGFVYVPNVIPSMDMTRGFELAVADDAANQLLSSYWAADGMTTGLDLNNGSYGEVGKLFDRVEMTAKVPPFIDASGEKLKLTVGDLMATFKNGPMIATQVAINAEVELKVVPGANGALRLDVGAPDVYVDILDELTEGANQLSNAQFEAVTSFGLSRIMAFGSGAVGAVPLPAFGGVSVQEVTIEDQDGYLVIGGEIE
ncbi:MAG: Ig-like domain-containing protein [Kofleriaceae bacterium]|nr:Ig-like domain-containing protein [Kofleriaceae bacterium]